ncbi:MAG: queuosine precursor transporter [Deltaproteobacteria bacterium]|nr:queuosine precursor transporter [Deltaproteobacteria bacterium]
MNSSAMDNRALPLYLLLSMVFVAALLTANMISGKIISLAGLFVPAGVLAYSITFAVTDVICEVWGNQRTQWVVRAGFLVQVLVLLLVQAAIYMPAAPFWPAQEAYAAILGGTGRIIVGSLTAYAVSQTLDVYLYGWLKQRFNSRHLWLRNNVATFVSQLVDTSLFITIAFYGGEMPLLALIGGQLAVKWSIALMDTPVVYLLVYLVRQKLGDAKAGAPASA